LGVIRVAGFIEGDILARPVTLTLGAVPLVGVCVPLSAHRQPRWAVAEASDYWA
jgi:hypothetical protein